MFAFGLFGDLDSELARAGIISCTRVIIFNKVSRKMKTIDTSPPKKNLNYQHPIPYPILVHSLTVESMDAERNGICCLTHADRRLEPIEEPCRWYIGDRNQIEVEDELHTLT